MSAKVDELAFMSDLSTTPIGAVFSGTSLDAEMLDRKIQFCLIFPKPCPPLKHLVLSHHAG